MYAEEVGTSVLARLVMLLWNLFIIIVFFLLSSARRVMHSHHWHLVPCLAAPLMLSESESDMEANTSDNKVNDSQSSLELWEAIFDFVTQNLR